MLFTKSQIIAEANEQVDREEQRDQETWRTRARLNRQHESKVLTWDEDEVLLGLVPSKHSLIEFTEQLMLRAV